MPDLPANPAPFAVAVRREGGERRYPETKVTVEVVSRVPIGPDVQASLGSLPRRFSPLTADALAEYRHDPSLFDVKLDP